MLGQFGKGFPHQLRYEHFLRATLMFLSESHFYYGKVILKIFQVSNIFDMLIKMIQP